jgi:hypothetical protein
LGFRGGLYFAVLALGIDLVCFSTVDINEPIRPINQLRDNSEISQFLNAHFSDGLKCITILFHAFGDPRGETTEM